MQLSQPDRERIAEWIQTKCGQLRCTCCGYGIFEIVPLATLPIGVDLHSMRFFYAHGVPQVSVGCRNCGHLLIFSSEIMGFKPDAPPPVPIPEGAK